MRVFVTGASGAIGSALVPELLGAGHEVVGLARSEASAAALDAAGAGAVLGDLADLDTLRDSAAAADGVIHLAFSNDFTAFAASAEAEGRAVAALGVVGSVPGGAPEADREALQPQARGGFGAQAEVGGAFPFADRAVEDERQAVGGGAERERGPGRRFQLEETEAPRRAEAGLGRRVVRLEFPEPRAEGLLQPERHHRAHAEGREAEILAGLGQRLVERHLEARRRLGGRPGRDRP